MAAPGYGDFLERARSPARAQRMAAMGAPEGFEDVVAWLAPMGRRPGRRRRTGASPSRVDDADATAARADELGGEVLVPPFDAPWVRMTVLRDPQGATFTASKFVGPES